MQKTVCPPPGTNFTEPALGIVNLSNHIYVPNLKVENWVEGGKSVEDLQFDLMRSNLNWTYCPYDKPFLIGESQVCSTCPADRPIYSLGTAQCITLAAAKPNTTAGATTTTTTTTNTTTTTSCNGGKYYNQ